MGLWVSVGRRGAAVSALCVAGVLLLSACGGNEASDSSNPAFRPTKKLKKIQKVLNEMTVYCSDRSAENCPEPAGFILSTGFNEETGSDGIFTCSGTLVSEDIVMTNRHCIPEEVQANPGLCSKRLGIMFPRSNTKASVEKFTCKELIRVSAEPESIFSDEDYAFFRIDKPKNRAYFKVSREGVPDGSVLTLYSINPPSTYSSTGTLVVKKCLIKHRSLMAPESVNEFSPTLFGYSLERFSYGPEACAVIQGNSGSAALNSKSQIVGLVQAIMNRDSGGTLDKIVDRINQNKTFKVKKEILRDARIFSNLACIEVPRAVNSEPPKNCTQAKSEAPYLDIVIESLGDQEFKESLKRNRDIPDSVQLTGLSPYVFAKDGQPFYTLIDPDICFKADIWTQQRTRPTELMFDLTVFETHFTLTPFWQMSMTHRLIRPSRSPKVKIIIPRKTDFSNQEAVVGKFTVDSKNLDLGFGPHDQDWEGALCSPEELSAPKPDAFDFNLLRESW